MIEGLNPGDWQVQAHLEDRVVTGKVTIPPGETLATLDLDPAFGELTLSGRLAGGGPAVEFMHVELLQESPEISYQPGAREYGIFRFTELREGNYRLRVYADSATGENVLHEQDIELSADRDVMIDLSNTDIDLKTVERRSP